MSDSLQELRDRFGGITRSTEVVSRIQLDLAQRAAQELEAEKRAEQQARADALVKEAGIIADSDARTVAILAALKPLYAERQEAARQAIEAIASLWRIEQDIRAGLSDADRIASSVEMLIEPTQRGAWRSALRERAGLDARHVFSAPKQWVATDAQRCGAAVVTAITASIIQPGRIETPRGDVIDFDV